MSRHQKCLGTLQRPSYPLPHLRLLLWMTARFRRACRLRRGERKSSIGTDTGPTPLPLLSATPVHLYVTQHVNAFCIHFSCMYLGQAAAGASHPPAPQMAAGGLHPDSVQCSCAGQISALATLCLCACSSKGQAPAMTVSLTPTVVSSLAITCEHHRHVTCHMHIVVSHG